MTDKEKQIEEMAREVENAKEVLWNTLYFDDDSYDWHSRGIAKHLFGMDYRKIPEGSVVLSREEHQHYCAYKHIEPQIKGCLDREVKLEKRLAIRENDIGKLESEIDDLKEELKQVRKETAREIFNKIKIKVLTEDMTEDRPQTLYRFTSFDIMKMSREIVEEFGVVFENGRAIIEVEE